MMKYQRFDELPAWQEAARLYQRVLDVVEEPNVPLSPTFRGNLERAALAVSNNIAESRDQMTGREAVSYLLDARAAATEVQSMMAVVSPRPKLARLTEALQQIRSLAESCGRQLSAWMSSIESGPSRSKEPTNAPAPGPTPPGETGGPMARRETQGPARATR